MGRGEIWEEVKCHVQGHKDRKPLSQHLKLGPDSETGLLDLMPSTRGRRAGLASINLMPCCGNRMCVCTSSDIPKGSKNHCQSEPTIYCLVLLRTHEQSNWKISPKNETKML